ncbi:MAG: hypothetical protein GX567_18040 [Clostridia bacterium]|nr:hypothetical protein [Clostridia bacterium]
MKIRRWFIFGFISMLIYTGCGYKQASFNVGELYHDIYEEASQFHTIGQLDIIQKIVNRLGENGLTAVDLENQNQVNMTHPERLEEFCALVENGQAGEVEFYSVTNEYGLIRYHLTTKQSAVEVERTVFAWDQNKLEITDEDHYPAHQWTYSDGYLFFEKKQPAGYDGAVGYSAFRIEPLDETCRAMNRSYIQPIGYAANEMFLKDFTENDFNALDFSDLFNRLYPYVYMRSNPYQQEFDQQEYLVAAEEFEKVITSYFKIDLNTLREQVAYRDDGYVIQTRGFDNAGYSPHSVYPEVVSYTEHEDGTLTLTVQVVWPYKHLASAMTHEVVVRPMQNGTFQYVSNHVIRSKDSVEPTWYSDDEAPF